MKNQCRPPAMHLEPLCRPLYILPLMECGVMTRELACRVAGLLLVSAGGGIALLSPIDKLALALSASTGGAPIAAWMVLVVVAAGLSLIFSTHCDQRSRDSHARVPARSAVKRRDEAGAGEPTDYLAHVDPAGFGSGRLALAAYLVVRDRAERERIREAAKIKRPHIVTADGHRVAPAPAAHPVS